LWSAAKGDKTVLIWGPLPGDAALDCITDFTLPAHTGGGGEPGAEALVDGAGMSVRSDGNSDEGEDEYSLGGAGLPAVEALGRVWTWSDHQQGHVPGVYALQALGSVFLSGGADGTVRVWARGTVAGGGPSPLSEGLYVQADGLDGGPLQVES
jgi:hypothetical protein